MNESNFVTQNVFLVEDDEATRQRLVQAINAHKHLKVVWSCTTLKEGLLILNTLRPDVLLVDLGLPDGSGIELIRAARSFFNEAIKIMVISVFSDERHTLEAIKAGASGYLLKDSDTTYIGEAILRLLAGESPISPGIARHVLKSCRNSKNTLELAESSKQQVPKLTKRETEVLVCISKGYTYHEVASMLGMSRNTITSHIKNIYRKLEVHSRGEAVFEAIQFGLVDVPT